MTNQTEQGPSPAAQVWMELMDATTHLKGHVERIHDQLMRILEPQMSRGVANEYATALSEILPKLSDVLPLADAERREELRGVLTKALTSLDGDGVRCLECSEPAVWVRRTQFSGSHYYCELHAKQQDDFGTSEDSYWKELTPTPSMEA
jgi:hypothetical protein